MTETTAGAVLSLLDGIAPLSTAEPWDNVGLLVGSPADPVRRIAVALDATADTVAQAAAAGAQLLVTHHPAIFSPLRRIARGDVPYLAAAAGVDLIAVHTDLDKAAGGVNDALAALLGLCDVTAAPDGMCRIGKLPAAAAPQELARLIGARLHTAVRVNAIGRPVRTLAVCGGSGGDLIDDLAGRADALLTGEVRHQQWLQANAAGLTVCEAGHFATEHPVVQTLHDRLRAAFPDIPLTVCAEQAPYETIGI